jgi:hypothetical protein
MLHANLTLYKGRHFRAGALAAPAAPLAVRVGNSDGRNRPVVAAFPDFPLGGVFRAADALSGFRLADCVRVQTSAKCWNPCCRIIN